jgi:hypothetical protein
MAGGLPKRRKRVGERRIFQDELEHDFFFVQTQNKGSEMCLLYREMVMGNKSFNLNRHHNTRHPNFGSTFSKTCKLREEKLKTLKKFVLFEQRTLFPVMNRN